MTIQVNLLSSQYGENIQVGTLPACISDCLLLIQRQAFDEPFSSPSRLSGGFLPRCDRPKSSLVGRGDAQSARHLGEGLGAAGLEGLLEEPSHLHSDCTEDGREGLHEDRRAVPDEDQAAEEVLPPEQQVGIKERAFFYIHLLSSDSRVAMCLIHHQGEPQTGI